MPPLPATSHPRRDLRPSGVALVTSLLLALSAGCGGMASAPPTVGPPPGPISGEAARQVLVTVDLEGSWRPRRAGTSGAVSTDAYRPSARTRRVVSDLARAYDLREVESWPIAVLGIHCVVFEISGAEDPDRILERLQSDARVESAQPMNLFETSSGLYNDPYLELQHGVSSMQVEEAHRWARGTGIEVAVVDTGVDIEHPELRDHIRLARDFVRADGRVPTPDRHGTAVTGVIVSAVDNGLGIIGVAPAAKILALQGCWQRDPKSAQGTCSSFTLAKALAFAVEQQPDILNLSLAGPHDPLLERLVRTALADDIVVVAAVGDSPAKPFPASVAGVMGVRAIPQAGDGAASTSDRDELLAPGPAIIPASPAGAFDFHSDHSLATAHVSGLIALLLERRPGLRAAELQELLRDTSVPVARLEASPGPPMVNACAALARLVAGPTCALD